MRSISAISPGVAAFGLLLAACSGQLAARETAKGTGGAELQGALIAQQVLDDNKTRKEREALIGAHPDKAVVLLKEMTRDIRPGTEEEYRRIPWIWRVTVAAGDRNDTDEIRQLLEVALPELDEPLHDWQAVVLGGGIVNGISRQGTWPAERISEILQRDSALQARWRRALELSSTMADDPEVPNPTRYDALRMVAMDSWDRRGSQLVAYLGEGIEDELQMGAISGLADMRSPHVSEALLSGLPNFSERNRNLALDAMLRTEERVETLLNVVAAGKVTATDLGRERIERLRNYENMALRTRARQLLSE